MSIRSAGLIAALVLATPASATVAGPALCGASIEAINRSVAKTLAQGSPGMLVMAAREGEPIFTGTYGLANIEHQAPVTRETIFNLASVTKQFTAAAILLLAEEGKLRLTDPLSLHVPEFPHADRITSTSCWCRRRVYRIMPKIPLAPKPSPSPRRLRKCSPGSSG